MFIPCLGIRFFAKTRIKALMPGAQFSSVHFFLRLCYIPWMMTSPSILFLGLQNLLFPKTSHFCLYCPCYPLVSSTVSQSDPCRALRKITLAPFEGSVVKGNSGTSSFLWPFCFFLLSCFVYSYPGTKSL